ncbi:MAG: ArnT family glycosyltransferase [Prochloraceae cyanobacterium]
MNRQIFTRDRFPNQLRFRERWLETACILGLLVAALVLYCLNLGGLPLRDWDEGTVAQVAKEIWQAPKDSSGWLFPTLWGEPYLNKPPLVHVLIALFYSLGGVNEWTTRLPSAILTAVSVPLLYSIGREIFPTRIPALFSALIYLTLLPVVRHGRLAMLDGAVLCFAMLTIWATLRARRDLRWTMVAGIGFGLICLTKGIVGLLVGAIALLFLVWDTPRLVTSAYLWLGILLGSMPAIAWYFAQYLHYSEAFVSTNIVGQSLQRIYASVEGHHGPVWYYLLEILKYSWPWLVFCLSGLKLARENRNWGWAKLILVWSGVYLAAVSIMSTKLPWYILPIYPALALAGGAQLAEVYHWPSYRLYPRNWTLILGLLATGTGLSSIYFSTVSKDNFFLVLALSGLTLALGGAAYLVAHRDRQFIAILFWGMYVSLVLFFLSPYWVWELNEAYPVKSVGLAIAAQVPPDRVVYTSFDYERPSLNFYSERRVIPIPAQKIENLTPQQLQSLIPISEQQKLKQKLKLLIPKNQEKLRQELQKLTSLTPQNLKNLKQEVREQRELKKFEQKLEQILKDIEKIAWLKQYWQQEPHPYLLIDRATFEQLDLESAQLLLDAELPWVPIGKNDLI